jgi:hypothetical protein
VARFNTASQRTDLPWAFACDALWAPATGACAVVLAPPADHPVFALRAASGTEPGSPKRQRRQANGARASLRANDRPRLRQWSQAFKIFTHAFERA